MNTHIAVHLLFMYTNPSPLKGVNFKDHRRRCENRRIINRTAPIPKKQSFSIFSLVLFSLQKHCDRNVSFLPSTTRISCNMSSRSIPVAEKFWCSYSLKRQDGVFFFFFKFLVWPREFAKPRSTKPRKATDRFTLLFPLGCFDCMLLKNQWLYFWCFGTCEYMYVCQYEPYIDVSFPSAWPLNGTMAYRDA